MARHSVVKSAVGVLVAASTLVPALAAQSPSQAFDIASVKKLERPAPFSPTRTPPRSAAFNRTNDTVASLIQFAYNLRDFELIGGADWIRRDQFEISARAAAEVSIDEMRPMVRALLQDRFKLVVRKEQRQMRYSALVLARDDGRLGPGLKECDVNVPLKPLRLPPGGRISNVKCAAISAVANLAAGLMRMPVVDRTGLRGLWDHEITFLIEPGTTGAGAGSPAPVVDPNLVPFPTALQEQLGLKLEPGRGPVDVLVVDSVQQPTEN